MPVSITTEEVADAVREWLSLTGPEAMTTLAAWESRSVGFGYRSAALRDLAARGETDYAAFMARFLDRQDYFRIELNELRTSVEGDIGFAWGTYTEEFQEKGRPPERARVRLSVALTKRPEGWRILSFHRDIQPFDADGRYLRSLTAIPPAD